MAARNVSSVTWSYTGSPGSNVQITLLKAGAVIGTINASTSIGSGGTGSYTWPISATGATGSDYTGKGYQHYQCRVY